MEHADLVAEMAHVEHLSTQERLHLARRRRLQQLKAWTQREKKWLGNKVPKSSKHIYFSDSVMLLEAAARNDIDEGKFNYSHAMPPHLCSMMIECQFLVEHTF
jgi:protein phosphatase 1 regulatory subunit 16A